MNTIRIIASVLGIAVVLCCSRANANLNNGGFEIGDLTGWSHTGPVSVEGLDVAPDGTLWSPTEGNYFASLWSANSDGTVTEATITQTFQANAQDVLMFDHFFDFGDAWYGYDTATATLTWAGGGNVTLFEYNTVVLLSPVASSSMASITGIRAMPRLRTSSSPTRCPFRPPTRATRVPLRSGRGMASSPGPWERWKPGTVV